MLQKEAKLIITFSVDTTELDEAIEKMKALYEVTEQVVQKMKELGELQEKK